MASKTFAAALLAALMASVVTVGGVFAHGDDNEDRNPGYGMRDDQGMGPGMMGGYGMGSGMMGAYGMGPGMMGGPMYGFELNSAQRKQIARIDTELRKRNWALQGEIIDARGKLFELYSDETPDAKKIGAVYGKIFDLRRQMIEAAIDARNRQSTVLTEEQREQLRKGPYGGGSGEFGPGRGRMGNQHGSHMMGG